MSPRSISAAWRFVQITMLFLLPFQWRREWMWPDDMIEAGE